MITELEIERALDFMRDNATKAAQAKANRAYMVEYRKVVKAQVMRESPGSLGSQEAEAYASQKYIEHLQAMKAAIEQDEYLTWMMAAAEAKISAWQTQSRNQRVNV